MKRKMFLSLILAASMMAACSSSTDTSSTDSSDSTSDTTTDETTDSSDEASEKSEESSDDTETSNEPELLSALIEAADDDTKAEAAWKALLLDTAAKLDYKFQIDTDGEDYLFDENQADTMVTDNFIYDIGKEATFFDDGDDTYYVSLVDVNDSYNDLLMGYGIIDRYGSDPALSAVQLTDTEDDSLKGTILSASTTTDSETDNKDDAATTAMIDATMDFGYVRTVTPITNSSYYKYDLTKDGSKWKLTVTLSDIDDFKNTAKTAGLIINDRNGRPTLVVDDIQGETFTFIFTSDGVLESEENDVYHVISGISEEYSQSYMNLLNKAEFKSVSDSDFKTSAFSDYFTGITDGSLKEDDSFDISDWN